MFSAGNKAKHLQIHSPQFLNTLEFKKILLFIYLLKQMIAKGKDHRSCGADETHVNRCDEHR